MAKLHAEFYFPDPGRIRPSGSHDYDIPAPLTLARQIGGLRLWMGAQHTGSFKADDLIVTYSK